jgi:hypothetical protein
MNAVTIQAQKMARGSEWKVPKVLQTSAKTTATLKLENLSQISLSNI